MNAQDVCGPPPSAADYATRSTGPNGEVLLSPLTPDQNAQYLAAVVAYQQCTAQFNQTPQCPVGQYFAGGLYDGVWQGHCVDDYTGQPTTPDVIVPAATTPGTQPQLPVTPTPTTAPPVTPTTPATPPTTTPPATTPSGSGSGSTTPHLQPHDGLFPGGGDGGYSYCDLFPDDPICNLWWPIGAPPGSSGGSGGTVTNTTIIQQVGLLASDVHQIVNDALKGLWGVVVGAIDLAFSNAIGEIQNALTALGNALKAAWNILTRLSGLILQFLGKLWYTIVHGLVLAVQQIADAIKKIFDGFLKPLLGWLHELRQKILEIWKRFVVPVLIVIQDMRRVLAILAAFHVKWAAKLDAQLADLERKITAPLITLLGYINQLANWMNLIVTAGYLLQKPLFLNTLKAYIGSSIGLHVNAMNQPLSASTVTAARATFAAPTAQQTRTDLAQFLDSGTGSFAPAIADGQAIFDQTLSQLR